jgi:site-specific recombinase XerD
MRKTTINHYVSLGNTLREFEKKAKFPLDISKINKVFYNKFRKYRLQDQENPVKPGTFGEQDIKLLKSFLEWAFWQEYPVDKIYKKFEKPRVEPDLRSLTEDQILLLWEMDLKDEQWKLDIFLNMISTCFSVSDQARYNSSWIQSVATYDKGVRTDRKVIVFKRQKSSSFCYIPFEDDLYFRPVFIFNKYNGELPKISDQYFNRWLKELSNKLNWGIDLSSKVARKTGATQRRRLGMNLENIMKITGHKSEKSLRSYLGMNVEDMLKDHADKAVYMKVS